MGKAEFVLARQKTRQCVHDQGIQHYMFYGPGSDEYWAAALRVLVVNMEPYGYEECGLVDVNLTVLCDWLRDTGRTKTRTVRYTMAILRTLIDAHRRACIPKMADLHAAYGNLGELEKVAAQTAYYNIRRTSNSDKAQDVGSILASGTGESAALLRDEITALEPHVILIGGAAGLTAFNALWRLKPPLAFHGRCSDPQGIVIQSIKHPSRPSYSKLAESIAGCVQMLRARK